MKRLAISSIGLILLIVLAFATEVQADVFNMGGTRNTDGTWTGLASLEMVTVGNAGNAPDTRYNLSGYGKVDYVYQIGKYEVTNAQYVEFLNAVAATDTYFLYSTSMWESDSGCKIQRSGSEGGYLYSIAPDRANRPVNYVSFENIARFCNWLHNGQPIGAQGPGTTEDGAYINIGTQPDFPSIFSRQEGAKWWIPSEDEWHKAAYHKNDGVTGNYFDYPTSSDIMPSNDLVDPDPGNNANFLTNDYTVDSPYYTTEVGEFENSKSAYGTFDQGGNLWERVWEVTPWGMTLRGLRGGFFNTSSNKLHASAHFTYTWGNEFPKVSGVGFRVASFYESVPGDANNDRQVNELDALRLAENWLRNGDAMWAMGDFNGDGNVNDIDATILAANWYSGIDNAVPEPGMLAMLVGSIAMLGLACWRSRVVLLW